MLIAQLSDPHLTTGALATEAAAGLHRALGRVLALTPRPDRVLISGDLTEHGSPEEYATLREMITRYPLPVHLAAGNHDGREAMIDAFGGTACLGGGHDLHYVVEEPELTLVVLDSLTEGRPEWQRPGLAGCGRLGPEQLTWLDGVLARRSDVPAVVCVHHPPVAVGIPFMDGIRLRDGDALAEVIGRHPHVVRVTTGHLHRATTTAFAGTVLTTAPSTFRQVSLAMHPDEQLGWVAEPTAFLLHRLAGTHCVTHIVQVSHTSGVIGVF
ncbi:phosphodiesterase [Micromonospora echinofusca]|uniref:Phosphodiesterase n=2 Tax=Micromonospora echinofusca TaxID=47858 RepID=A0ABS3VUI1_MICEH|nr:phosphodiesterase [Micromonospora echinofusca]